MLRWRALGLVSFETGLLMAAVAFSTAVRFGEVPENFGEQVWRWILIAGVAQFCLYFADLYDYRVFGDRRELFVRSVQALGAASIILALIYFWLPDLMVGRGVFMLAVCCMITLILGWRLTYEWLNQRIGPRERLLLVGTGESAVQLARELYERRDIGVEIVGFIDPDPARVGQPVLNPGIVGSIDDIPSVARALSVDRVVVSLGDARGRLPMEKLLDMRLEGTTFDHLATVYEEYTGKIAIENLRPSWLIFSDGFKKSRVLTASKRALDIFAASVGLLLVAPAMLVIAAAIKLTSRGPVFYHQSRVGQHGRVFTVHKFRSMHENAEAATGAVWAQNDDARVTAIGPILRRTRLDEVPQLWNVLVGDMSLVGPRPERPEFVTSLTKQIPYYGQRHIVKPGVTGWAQVCYCYGASVEDAMEKLQYDLFYIKNLSLAFDVFIIFKTIKVVLLQRGAQ